MEAAADENGDRVETQQFPASLLVSGVQPHDDRRSGFDRDDGARELSPDPAGTPLRIAGVRHDRGSRLKQELVQRWLVVAASAVEAALDHEGRVTMRLECLDHV